jgi:hypothetical protein
MQEGAGHDGILGENYLGLVCAWWNLNDPAESTGTYQFERVSNKGLMVGNITVSSGIYVF